MLATGQGMKLVRFTKFWAGLTPQEMGKRSRDLGYDGLDLAVRAEHPINPQNVATALPIAITVWKDLGIECSMMSAGTDVNDPTADEAIALFHSAAAVGIARIKIGYFTYTPGHEFGDTWTHARHMLDGFEALSRETGVQTIYHTHSGRCLGSNCAGLRHLLEDYGPVLVGAYVDLGHIAINGEDIQLGLPMVRDRLAVIGAKDARHVPDKQPERRAPFADGFVFVGQGAAEWPEAIALLNAWGFDGPITIHTEYTSNQDVISTVGAGDNSAEAEAMRSTGEIQDLLYLRSLMASVPST